MRRRLGKVVFYTTSAATLGFLGTTGYAYVDPKFRKSIENSIPGSYYVFSKLFTNSLEASVPVTHTRYTVGDVKYPAVVRENEVQGMPSPVFPDVGQTNEQVSAENMPNAKSVEREEVGKLVEELIEKKLLLLTDAQKAVSTPKVQLARLEFEEELKKELAKQNAAHASHEEQMLQLQRESLDVQHKKEIQKVLAEERQQYMEQLSQGIAQLTALEVFLNGRNDFDRQSRRAKKLWISLQNFKGLLNTRPSNHEKTSNSQFIRIPLANVISDIRNASESDVFITLLLKSIPEDVVNTGVYSEEDLLRRYNKVKLLCKRTARIDKNSASLFQYLLSHLQSLFIWDREKDTIGSTEINTENISVYELLSRTSFCLNNRDYESAIRLMSLLKGEPARIASDWLADLKTRVEVQQLTDLMIAHASAQSIRSLY